MTSQLRQANWAGDVTVSTPRAPFCGNALSSANRLCICIGGALGSVGGGTCRSLLFVPDMCTFGGRRKEKRKRKHDKRNCILNYLVKKLQVNGDYFDRRGANQRTKEIIILNV